MSFRIRDDARGGCWKDGPDKLALVLEFAPRGSLSDLFKNEELCGTWESPRLGIALGVLLLVPFLRESRILRLLGLGSMLVGAGIALLHTGVERGWWEGPTECSGGPGGDLSADQLLDAIRAAPLVRCDEVAWSMMGLSMASWNGIASVALALFWAASLRRS